MTKDRDEQGRFLPGHAPSGPEKDEYMESFKDATDPEAFAKATRVILEKAKQGDVRAYKELSKFCLGKPTSRVDIRAVALGIFFQEAIDEVYGEKD
jgi:hypothetical protein